MLTNIKYILLTALRDWLFSALALMIIACAMIANFLGNTALIENTEMAIVFSSEVARSVIIFGLILFSCFHVRNAFDSHEIDVFLSRPVTRSSLVFSYWLGFAVIASILAVPALLMIMLQGVLNWQGVAFWAISLLLECWLMVAVAIFAAFTMNSSVVCVIFCLCFYCISRLMGFFVADLGASTNIAINWFGTILPRLDYFTRSDWLIYGLKNTEPAQMLIFAQGAFFIPAFIVVTIFWFKRKEF